MVTILIVGAILAMTLWVFKLYWKDICNWCAKIVTLAVNVLRGVITFVRSGSKVIAYLYRRLIDGTVDRQPIPAPQPITIQVCPQEVQDALFADKEVLVNDDVTRQVYIN